MDRFKEKRHVYIILFYIEEICEYLQSSIELDRIRKLPFLRSLLTYC